MQICMHMRMTMTLHDLPLLLLAAAFYWEKMEKVVGMVLFCFEFSYSPVPFFLLSILIMK